jgi:hypothetical protein
MYLYQSYFDKIRDMSNYDLIREVKKGAIRGEINRNFDDSPSVCVRVNNKGIIRFHGNYYITIRLNQYMDEDSLKYIIHIYIHPSLSINRGPASLSINSDPEHIKLYSFPKSLDNIFDSTFKYKQFIPAIGIGLETLLLYSA